jgi:hypothetical protein
MQVELASSANWAVYKTVISATAALKKHGSKYGNFCQNALVHPKLSAGLAKVPPMSGPTTFPKGQNNPI